MYPPYALVSVIPSGTVSAEGSRRINAPGLYEISDEGSDLGKEAVSNPINTYDP